MRGTSLSPNLSSSDSSGKSPLAGTADYAKYDINLSRKARQGGKRNADQSGIFLFPFSLIGSLITAGFVVIMFACLLQQAV